MNNEKVQKGKKIEELSKKLNEETTTAFPVSDAIPKIEPGVYAMVARPADKKSDDGNGWVSQWFVLFTLFIGLNLIQSSFNGFFPAAMVFKALGIERLEK